MSAQIQIAEHLEDSEAATALKESLRQNADQLLSEVGYEESDVSVLLTDNEQIHQLNRDWRSEDKPTDVLSFPLHGPDDVEPGVWSLGDIVISLEYADTLVEEGEHDERIAKQLGVEQLDWSLSKETHFLFIHGLLHLLGYNHIDDDEEAQMKRLETQLWQSLSL